LSSTPDAGEKAFIFLYGLGATNPAFDGWVFEADFFFQCKMATEMDIRLTLKGKVDLELDLEPDLDLDPRSLFNFNHDDMLRKARFLSASCTEPLEKVAEDKLKKDIKGKLLGMVNKRCKPTKWNQGGYDGFDVSAGAITNEISIDFFQVTRGASHPLNLKYFVEVVQLFIDAGCLVCGCDIYYVIPEGETTTISKVTPHGSLFYEEQFGFVNGREKEKIRVVTLKKTTSVTTP
jgi:hypothetical protein